MGITTLKARLSNPRDRRRAVEKEPLVDSGAIYAVVPAPVLRRIGVRPSGNETFTLADGTHITRSVGTAFFEIDGREGASRSSSDVQGTRLSSAPSRLKSWP